MFYCIFEYDAYVESQGRPQTRIMSAKDKTSNKVILSQPICSNKHVLELSVLELSMIYCIFEHDDHIEIQGQPHVSEPDIVVCTRALVFLWL